MLATSRCLLPIKRNNKLGLLSITFNEPRRGFAEVSQHDKDARVSNLELFDSQTSPFSRKVRIVISELELHEKVKITKTSPWLDTERLRSANPLGKVPALLFAKRSAKGEEVRVSLYDSPVICEFLASIALDRRGEKLFPRIDNERRWISLRRQALGDGLCDAVVKLYEQERLSESQRSAAIIDRQRQAIELGLNAFEAELQQYTDITTGGDNDAPGNIGDIAIGTALGYLEFRFPMHEWRPTRPLLADWFDAISQRPSFMSTRPIPPKKTAV